ncbi:hypothetical protein BJV74DRAFT_862119 [Russula compacta]|nr:hypothetical protein BJV74DRAFT_862119 [Russula compacta]
MMTRVILDGSDLEQAMRQQMTIIFMISASNALSGIIDTHLVLRVCVDSSHRIRGNRIDTRTLPAEPAVTPSRSSSALHNGSFSDLLSERTRLFSWVH